LQILSSNLGKCNVHMANSQHGRQNVEATFNLPALNGVIHY
jgi:hypothetical protein